ncbi:MAG: bifunctional oligoribonuclease/PAP phosphatase NrnA [Phycisphaerae bacterium]
MSSSLTTTGSKLDEIAAAVRDANCIALLGHETPDADSLGSTGALWLALRDLGKHARLLVPGGISRKLEYLIGFARLDRLESTEGLASCDLVIVCDTAKEKRINVPGGIDTLSGLKLVNMDHHATNAGFGDIAWIDEHRSSTSEMAYELIRRLGAHITPTIATLLFAGIHSDTQGFSLSNTTQRSFEVAHDLSQAGAHIVEVCEQLERSVSPEEFALLKVVYANTQVSRDGRVSWSTATYDEIAGAGCNADSIDDQVEIPRSIAGVKIAILFTEGEPGVIRMNFRGDTGLSVLGLAQQFGGGGHHAAAGARRRGAIAQVVNEVIPATHAYLESL